MAPAFDAVLPGFVADRMPWQGDTSVCQEIVFKRRRASSKGFDRFSDGSVVVKLHYPYGIAQALSEPRGTTFPPSRSRVHAARKGQVDQHLLNPAHRYVFKLP